MSHPTYRDLVDEVTEATLSDLLTLRGPVVSIYLPTHRAQPNLDHDALVLRSEIDAAQRALLDHGVAERTAGLILRPLRELVEDRPFWAEQGEGLAVFADEHTHRVLRLPIAVPTRGTVSERAHLAPLLPAVSGGQTFALLALSLGRVRLFRASRSSIDALDLGPIPESLADMERRTGREPQLQHQHQPPSSGAATFHGHGGAGDSGAAEAHFLLEVADGVRERLGPDYRHPIVLAAVAEHRPALAATGTLPTLLDEVVPGNHDVTAPHTLLEAAWPLVERATRASDRALRAEAERWLGTGRALANDAAIAEAAREGRVATLLLDPGAPPTPERDAALAAALATGARVQAVPEPTPEAAMVALLRYATP